MYTNNGIEPKLELNNKNCGQRNKPKYIKSENNYESKIKNLMCFYTFIQEIGYLDSLLGKEIKFLWCLDIHFRSINIQTQLLPSRENLITKE